MTATVIVCLTCRRQGAVPDPAPDPSPAGTELALATRAAAQGSDVTVQGVRCLANCARGPSAVIRVEGAWTYVFGSLDPDADGPALVEGARLLAAAADGVMPWRGRPTSLKRGMIARVPPMTFTEETP